MGFKDKNEEKIKINYFQKQNHFAQFGGLKIKYNFFSFRICLLRKSNLFTLKKMKTLPRVRLVCVWPILPFFKLNSQKHT